DIAGPTNAKSIATYPESRKPERYPSTTHHLFTNYNCIEAGHVPNPQQDAATRIATIVEEYRQHDNLGALFDGLRQLARDESPETLIDVSRPYRDLPEVVIPLFESVTERVPSDAQSLVVLANAYWLTGRGPETVGRLAD